MRERQEPQNKSLVQRVTELALGMVALAVFAGFFASGWSPPGIAGEVLRHNQQHNIDASPLFYSEVEHMAALEKGVEQLRVKATKCTLDENEK